MCIRDSVRAPCREDLVAHHDLYDPARVSQVQERHPTEVSPLRHPSRKRHLLTRVLSSQSPCFVGTDHRLPSLGFQPSHPTGSAAPTSRRLRLVAAYGRHSQTPLTRTVRSSAGGSHDVAVAATWSPDRMSLTSPSSPPNHTYGIPRRSAWRICLPN